MRPRLSILLVLAAGCGGGGSSGGGQFSAAVRVLEAPDVDDVTADARGAVCTASGQTINRLDGSVHAIADGGQPVTLADRLDHPRDPQLAGDSVYFLTRTGVYRVPRAGGADPKEILPAERPTALALAGDEVLVGLDNSIVAVPADGAARAVVGGAGTVADLAVAGDRLLWLDRAGGRVMRAKLDGTDVTAIAEGQVAPVALAVSGPEVVWITAGDTARSVEATVMRAPIAGGTPKVLHRGGYGYEAVAIDGRWVTWSWGDVASTVQRVRLEGGGAMQEVVGNQTDLDGVAVDGGGLWIGGPDGLYRVRRK